MSTENTNNIDDLLLNINKEPSAEPESEEIETEEVDIAETSNDYEASSESSVEEAEEPSTEETDEYGNEVSTEQESTKPAERYYTQAEVQQMMQERLERQARNMQKQSSDDEDSPDFQQQLKSMIENAVTEVQQKNAARQQQEIEMQRQQEFEDKFRRGTTRFKDFTNVVANKPISDYMLQATSGMNDPSGFIYAACKRAPEEVERISKITNPYAQVLEIAKLESKLKTGKTTTQAPRPIKGTKGDSMTKTSPDKPRDILAAADSERWARMQRR